MTEYAREVMGLSVQVAFWATVLLLPPSVACAWFLSRREFPGKSLVEGCLYLPLVMPPVVTGYGLLCFLGIQSPVGQWLSENFGIRLAFTWKGAVLVSMVMAFPLMVRSIRLSLDQMDRRLEEAARLLGAGPIRTFCRITLPLALPGILAGMILAFARSLGEFGATITFAGNIEGETRTLPLAIYSLLQRPGGDADAMALVIPAVLLSLFALAASERMTRRERRETRT
jgi:molybdate transport system permease protein